MQVYIAVLQHLLNIIEIYIQLSPRT